MAEIWDVGTIKIKSSRTRSDVQWKIREFFRYEHFDNTIWFSEPFKMWERWWYMSCYSPFNSNECISLSLRTSHQHRSPHTTCCIKRVPCKELFRINTVYFIWGIKKEDGTTYLSSESKRAYETSFEWRFRSLMELRFNKDEIFPNGCITFFITISSERESIVTIPQECKINEEEISQEEEEDEYFGSIDADTLSQNLKDLFLSEQNCDIIIKVEERAFKAHKVILAARSTVLASMFKNDMEESRSGVIKIPDCDPDAFWDFLHYLYTAKVDDFSEVNNISALYTIAHKYNVKELSLKCVKFMVKRVTVDSFCDFLFVALKYNESELLEVMEKYFANHIHRILVTPKWQSFINEYPLAANELLIKFSSKLNFK